MDTLESLSRKAHKLIESEKKGFGWKLFVIMHIYAYDQKSNKFPAIDFADDVAVCSFLSQDIVYASWRYNSQFPVINDLLQQKGDKNVLRTLLLVRSFTTIGILAIQRF